MMARRKPPTGVEPVT